MKNLILRKAGLKDRSTLLNLEQKVIEAERPFDSAIKPANTIYYDMDNLLQSQNSYLVVAELNDEIIGTGYAQIRTSKGSANHAKHSYLGFMYVSPNHRGLGINKKIIAKLMDWSKGQGVHDYYLDVYVDNIAAIRAYEKTGFVKSMVSMKMNVNNFTD